MNGCVWAKDSITDEDVSLNDLSHHQTFEIGYKCDSNNEYFIGEIKNMKFYYDSLEDIKCD